MSNQNKNNDTELRFSNLENRLNAMERFVTPSHFKRVEIAPIFPIEHLPDDLQIRILAYLNKRDYLSCKIVCKQWDYVRHSVAVMRRQISTPVKQYIIRSRNYPSRYWHVRDPQCVRIEEQQHGTFQIVPALYRADDETNAVRWNQRRYNMTKEIVSFRCPLDGSFLRHAGYFLRKHRYEDSKLYRLDASFYMTKNEFFDCDDGGNSNGNKIDYYTFHSVNYDGCYISHRGFQLKIDNMNGSDLHKNDASFSLHIMP